MPITKIDGKRRDGKQAYRVRVNYTNAFGEYKQAERTAYGYAEAQELEGKLIRELQEHDAPKNMTVTELFEEYMKARSQEIRPTTLDKMRRNLELAVLPIIGKYKISRLNAQIMQEWKNTIGDRGLKLSTKRNYFKHLNTMLTYAVKREYIHRNPLELVGNFVSTEFTPPEEKIQYYTVEEYMRFARVARAHTQTFADFAYYVFFSIAFYTGMRKGEINALRWSDVEGNILHIRRSVSQKIKGEYVETLPKTKASYRDLQIPQPLIAILAEHKVRQMADPRFDESYRVCGGIKCLSDTGIENRNKQYGRAAGLHHIRIHDFRHTHATLLVNEGINIQEIARRLGHDDVQVTWQTYAHLYPREEERAVAILEKITDTNENSGIFRGNNLTA